MMVKGLKVYLKKIYTKQHFKMRKLLTGAKLLEYIYCSCDVIERFQGRSAYFWIKIKNVLFGRF